MQARNCDHLFQRFTFQKTTTEIIDKAKAKISQLQSKMEERQSRIRDLRESYKISDAAFVDILGKMRENMQKGGFVQNYSTSSTDNHGNTREITVGAGVVNHLLTENDYITAERESVERLTFIVNNLRDGQHTSDTGTKYTDQWHTLSFAELEYLEF
jgi:hypothetical protein